MPFTRLCAVLAFMLTPFFALVPTAQAQTNRITAFPESFDQLVM